MYQMTVHDTFVQANLISNALSLTVQYACFSFASLKTSLQGVLFVINIFQTTLQCQRYEDDEAVLPPCRHPPTLRHRVLWDAHGSVSSEAIIS